MARKLPEASNRQQPKQRHATRSGSFKSTDSSFGRRQGARRILPSHQVTVNQVKIIPNAWSTLI
jgi:hypothetical protein